MGLHFLLRTIGLGIISAIVTPTEKPKYLVHSSWTKALLPCTIHIVPSALSIVLATVNIRGYFIGSISDESRLGLIQIAAKIQELLMISSMSSIIFHFIRHELIFGDGLPLGLTVSGWMFSQVSYFWSTDFWGGVISPAAHYSWRRTVLVLLISFGVVIALLSGPASAVLMTPVMTNWHAGGAIAWLNGSDAQLWPTELSADSFSGINCTSAAQQFGTESLCPSAGLLPLHALFSRQWSSRTPGDMFTHDSFIRQTIHSRPPRNLSTMDSWAYTGHQATSRLQDALRSLHYQALRWLHDHHPNGEPYAANLRETGEVTFEMKTRVPAARVLCLEQTRPFWEPRRLLIQFARLEEYKRGTTTNEDGSLLTDRVAFDLTNQLPTYLHQRGVTTSTSYPLNLTEIFADSRRLLVMPHDLGDKTAASSLGLLLLLDGRDDKTPGASPIKAMACSIDARWSEATSIMRLPSSRRQPGHEADQGKGSVPLTTKLDSPLMDHLRDLLEPFDPPNDGTLTVVRLSTSWYDFVSPLLPPDVLPAPDPLIKAGKGQTAFERHLEVKYYGPAPESRMDQLWIFQNTISIITVEAVSRSGSFLNQATADLISQPLNNGAIDAYTFDEKSAKGYVRFGDAKQVFDIPDALRGRESKKMKLKAIYTGYVLASSMSIFNWFCAVLLLTHSLIAMIYCVWVVAKERWTSYAWGAISELIVLAQRSEPPKGPLLENTSAGTRSFQVPRLLTRVETVPDSMGGNAAIHRSLRFVIDSHKRGKSVGERATAGTRYD